jgi:hypothetical protein
LGVLGIGAIGGSVARRARQGGVPLVLGWSPDPAERVAAAREGVVDDAPAHAAELAARCDLLVLAGSPAASLRWLESLARARPARALITDIGSQARDRRTPRRSASPTLRGAPRRRASQRSRCPAADGARWPAPCPTATSPREIAPGKRPAAPPVLIDAERHDALAAHAAQPLRCRRPPATALAGICPRHGPAGRCRAAASAQARTPCVEGGGGLRPRARALVPSGRRGLWPTRAAPDTGAFAAALAAASRWRTGLGA